MGPGALALHVVSADANLISSSFDMISNWPVLRDRKNDDRASSFRQRALRRWFM
jgi:hypothetical protein